MKRNDLWLNVKGNYIFFKGKIILYLYLEFIPKDWLFHKMLQLSLMGFLTGWCNLQRSLAYTFWLSKNPDSKNRYSLLY